MYEDRFPPDPPQLFQDIQAKCRLFQVIQAKCRQIPQAFETAALVLPTNVPYPRRRLL
jgi:hypothetical protein